MSWSASGYVNDGSLDNLEHTYQCNKKNNHGLRYNSSTDEQFEFCCNVVQDAFLCGVLDGAYKVTMHGHSSPDQVFDRKAISISFAPISLDQIKQVAQVAAPNNSVEVDE